MIRLGAQLSQTRGFDRVIQEAGDAGLQCVQVFSRNPVGGQSRALPRAGTLKPVMDDAGVDTLFVHAPYFVNPAALEEEKHERAKAALTKEMRRAKRLSAQYVVVHPGHGPKHGDWHAAVDAFVDTITKMLSAPGRILIENTAGQGRELGSQLDQLGQIFERLGKTRRIGLMFDTAHAMASGYPLENAADAQALWHEIDQYIGRNRLIGIHLNDSEYPVHSRRDRHAHLLSGCLGESALQYIVGWARDHQCCLVLETPGRDAVSRCDDIAMVRRLAQG